MHIISEEFITEDKARAYLRDYYRRYNKAQYGTRLGIRRQRISQHWEVYGHRFH
ncbi:hypothetical protein [Ensifer aridi]|uniref:hypothetical protein n=1 Tax=Ensifer aridi TaxID=1708715 RepID=UPI0015E48609|nr:hypothetical protein [Ensifer aridi]